MKKEANSCAKKERNQNSVKCSTKAINDKKWKTRIKNKGNEQKTVTSLAGINLTKSIITLNGIGLNTPNIRQIFIQILEICINLEKSKDMVSVG